MKMKCPYNNFAYCYEEECPFYIFKKEWKGNDKFGRALYKEKYVCGRAEKELNENGYIQNDKK